MASFVQRDVLKKVFSQLSRKTFYDNNLRKATSYNSNQKLYKEIQIQIGIGIILDKKCYTNFSSVFSIRAI